MVVSLRCIGLKVQKAIFINTAFDFNNEIKPNNYRHIIAELMNFAVFNRNVANNTADIFKAARYFLSLGIFFTFISFIVMLRHLKIFSKLFHSSQDNLKFLN